MPGRKQFRRLVLMFDGTWNERSNLTNVARMFEAIDDQKPDPDDSPSEDEDAEPVQLVKYLSGVGTKWLPVAHYLGGAVGYGLSDIIKEGYLWLSNTYRPGDEIFVFGFSRGAYSARSLVSLVHRCGGVLMLKPGESPRTLQHHDLVKAYNFYRDYTGESSEAKNAASLKEWQAFGAQHCRPVTIKMLGVWDTVGALGIPDSMFTIKSGLLKPLLDRLPFSLDDYIPWSRKHYEFHGQGLPCIVENAYHALAIDENREDFAPTLWSSRKPENKDVQQVWFIGSHCNVGGGATTDADEDPDDLWWYSYSWMQNKAAKLGLRFYWTYGQGKEVLGASRSASGTGLASQSSESISKKTKRRVSKTKPQDSYGQMAYGIYAWMRKPFDRAVVNSKGAALHWSVRERILQDKRYRPKSLEIGNTGTFHRNIPNIPLPEEICTCKLKHDGDATAAASASDGHPTKKQS